MSSQYKAPLFTQIVTSQIDRINERFSNQEPSALNAVLALSDMLKGYQDDLFRQEKEKQSLDYNKVTADLTQEKEEGQLDGATYSEKLSVERMNYAHSIYGSLGDLMKRKSILPADNADDDNAIEGM